MPTKYEFKMQMPIGSLSFLILVMTFLFIFFMSDKNDIEDVWFEIVMFIVIVIFITWRILANPVSQLKAYEKYILISGNSWWFNYNIPVESIVNLHAITNSPFRDYWFIPLIFFNSRYGWKPGCKWREWIPSNFVSTNDNAIAIETTDKKFLIACPDPETAVKELRVIFGL